ncbi:hypothetical protein HIM_08025 [Hirsutella minnesotensis 3608]|uniref:Uncharacterized protein n=1 Tax=Hirsutella minnesotensis 3608 TaxID=1043627 RepID=A0A0F7ZHH8_9HYPO|nr:hypothetical protein HIM_08025 [Hirsutella minnesotensis 3608]
MANGFDRLERLFAYKRRPSPGPSRQPSLAAVQIPEPQFPSPSFIRPKASRMAARDEVRLRQAAGRSPSVPDILPTQRSASHCIAMSPSSITYLTSSGPVRSPSFSSQHTERLVAGLRDFQFPMPATRDSSCPAPPAISTRTLDPSRLPSPRSRSPLYMELPPTRSDTPPSSGPDDDSLFLSTPPSKTLPDLPCRAPPTPGETPEFGPVLDSQLRGSKSLDCLGGSGSKNLLSDFNDSFDQVSLNRTYSQSSIAPSAQLSFCSSTLREPDFNEFLNLSDDDIAESTPVSPTLPPSEDFEPALPPMDLSISSSLPLTSSLLTLAPPRTSRPAAVAAFEAARIARRYDFDLVYVVNLWPDASQAVMSSTKAPDCTTSKPMMGRLLAAHGLHHVPSPLQISSLVHTTILRSDGWIEYRNQDAQCHDLARGYACSFYTGQYARNSYADAKGPVSGVRLSERIDRGIVFAAYRKPRDGEDKLGRTFTEEELGELHGEAEALVEMLIDIHVANRMRQPPAQHFVPDETGPMPVQH